MDLKLTRREMASALAGAAAATPGQAQPAPASPGNDQETVRARLRTSGGEIAKVALPMSTEPAFRFKA